MHDGQYLDEFRLEPEIHTIWKPRQERAPRIAVDPWEPMRVFLDGPQDLFYGIEKRHTDTGRLVVIPTSSFLSFLFCPGFDDQG